MKAGQLYLWRCPAFLDNAIKRMVYNEQNNRTTRNGLRYPL